MQHKSKKMKKMKILLGLSLMMALTLSVQAGGKTGGGGTPPPPPPPSGAFTFTYNVGTVANYHAYGLACPVGSVKPRPAGTLVLGKWWVWDLGPVTGMGIVSCPKPVATSSTSSVLGVLFFADASDLGGQAFTYPVVDVQIYTPRWYNGYASIEVITPADKDSDDTGIQLYYGAPFTPFACDISAYVWNVEPSTW